MPLSLGEIAQRIYDAFKQKGYSDALSVAVLKQLVDLQNPTHVALLDSYRHLLRQKREQALAQLKGSPTEMLHPPYVTVTTEEGKVERYALPPDQLEMAPLPQPRSLETITGKLAIPVASFVEGLRQTGVDIAKAAGALHTLKLDLERPDNSPIPPLHRILDIEHSLTPDFVADAFGAFVSSVPALLLGSFTGGASLYVIPTLFGSQAMAEQLAFDEERPTVYGAIAGRKPSAFAVGLESAFSTYLFGKSVQSVERMTRPIVTRVLVNIAPDKRSFARAVAHYGIGALAAGTYGAVETSIVSGLHGHIPSGERLGEVFLNYALIDMFNRAYGTFIHYQTPAQRNEWNLLMNNMDEMINTMYRWRKHPPQEQEAKDTLAAILKYPVEEHRNLLLALFRRRLPLLTNQKLAQWINEIKGIDYEKIQKAAQGVIAEDKELHAAIDPHEPPAPPPAEFVEPTPAPRVEASKSDLEVTEMGITEPTPGEAAQTIERAAAREQRIVVTPPGPPELVQKKPIDIHVEERKNVFGLPQEERVIRSARGIEVKIPAYTQVLNATTVMSKALFSFDGRREGFYTVNAKIPGYVVDWAINSNADLARKKNIPATSLPITVISAFGGAAGDLMIYAQSLRHKLGNAPIRLIYNDLNPTLAKFISSFNGNVASTGELIDSVLGFVKETRSDYLSSKITENTPQNIKEAIANYANQVVAGFDKLIGTLTADLNKITQSPNEVYSPDIDTHVAATLYVLNAFFPRTIDEAIFDFRKTTTAEMLNSLITILSNRRQNLTDLSTVNSLENVRFMVKNAAGNYKNALISTPEGRETLAKTFNGRTLKVFNRQVETLLQELIKKADTGEIKGGLYGKIILLDPPHYMTRGYTRGKEYTNSLRPHIKLIDLAYEAAKRGAVVVYHNSTPILEATENGETFAEMLLKRDAMVQIVRAKQSTRSKDAYADTEMIALFLPRIEVEPKPPEPLPKPSTVEPPPTEPSPTVLSGALEPAVTPGGEKAPIFTFNLPEFPEEPSIDAYRTYIKESAQRIVKAITDKQDEIVSSGKQDLAKQEASVVYERFNDSIASALKDLQEKERFSLYNDIADDIIAVQMAVNKLGINDAGFYVGEIPIAVANATALMEAIRNKLSDRVGEDTTNLVIMEEQLDTIMRGLKAIARIAEAVRGEKESSIDDLLVQYDVLQNDIARYYLRRNTLETIRPANPPAIKVETIPKEQVTVITGESPEGEPTTYDAVRLAIRLDDIIFSHYFDLQSLQKIRDVIAAWHEQIKTNKDVPPPSVEGITLRKVDYYPLIHAGDKEVNLETIRDIALAYIKDPSLVRSTILSSQSWLSTGVPVVFWDAERSAFVPFVDAHLLAIEILPDEVRQQVFTEIEKYIIEEGIPRYDDEPDGRDAVVARVLVGLDPETLQTIADAINVARVKSTPERDVAYNLATTDNIPLLYSVLESADTNYLNSDAASSVRNAVRNALTTQDAETFFISGTDQLNAAGIRLVQNLLMIQTFKPYKEAQDIVDIALDPFTSYTVRQFLLNVAIPIGKIRQQADTSHKIYDIVPDIITVLQHIGKGLREGLPLQLAITERDPSQSYSSLAATMLDILSSAVHTPVRFDTVLADMLKEYAALMPQLKGPPEAALADAAHANEMGELVGVTEIKLNAPVESHQEEPEGPKVEAEGQERPARKAPQKRNLLRNAVDKAREESNTNPPITEQQFIDKSDHHAKLIATLKNSGFEAHEIAVIQEVLRNTPPAIIEKLLKAERKEGQPPDFYYGSKDIRITLTDDHLRFMRFIDKLFRIAWETTLSEEDKEHFLQILTGKGLTGSDMEAHKQRVRVFASTVGIPLQKMKVTHRQYEPIYLDKRIPRMIAGRNMQAAKELGSRMFQAWILTGLPVTQNTEKIFNSLRVGSLEAISRILAANYIRRGFDKRGNIFTLTDLTEIFRKIAYSPGAPIDGTEQEMPTDSLLGAIRQVARKGIAILTIPGNAPMALGIPKEGGVPVLFVNADAAKRLNFKGTIIGTFEPDVYFFNIKEPISSKPLDDHQLRELGLWKAANIIRNHYDASIRGSSMQTASILFPESTKTAEQDISRVFLELKNNVDVHIGDIGNDKIKIVEKPIYFTIGGKNKFIVTSPTNPAASVVINRVMIVPSERFAENMKTIVTAFSKSSAAKLYTKPAKIQALKKIAKAINEEAGTNFIDIDTLVKTAARDNGIWTLIQNFKSVGAGIIQAPNKPPEIVLEPLVYTPVANIITSLRQLEAEGATLLLGSEPHQIVRVTREHITLSREGKETTVPLGSLAFRREDIGQILKVWRTPEDIEVTVVGPKGLVKTVPLGALITEKNLVALSSVKWTKKIEPWEDVGAVPIPNLKTQKGFFALPVFPKVQVYDKLPTITDPAEIVAKTWEMPVDIVVQAKKAVGLETQPYDTLTPEQWRQLYAIAKTLQSIPDPPRFRGFIGGVARFLLGDRISGAPMEFIRQAPQNGPNVVTLVTNIENFARDVMGEAFVTWEDAWWRIPATEMPFVARFIQSGEFYARYRKGQPMPTQTLANLAEAIRKIFDRYYELEASLNIMQMNPITKKWEPIRRVENYLPISLTPEAIGVLAAKSDKDPRWHVLRQVIKSTGIDPGWFASQLINPQRPFGHLEVARVVNLPQAIEEFNAKMKAVNPNYGNPKEGQIMVNGKPFQVVVTDITQLVPFYIGRAAMRMGIIKEMGQGSPLNPIKSDRSPQKIFEGLMAEDRTAAYAWKYIWDNLNHYRLTSEEWSVIRPLNEMLDGIRGIQLSMAWLWQPTGYIPIAEVFGLKNAIRAFYQTFTPEGQKVLERLRLRNVWGRDVLPYTSFAHFSLTGAGARFSRALLALTPLNAINRHINKTVALATVGYMREIAGKPLSVDDKAILKELADFSDEQIKMVEQGNVTEDLIAQAARRAVARINGFQESAGDIAPLYRHPLGRSLLAYTQWTRLMGRHMANAVLQAQKGNFRPLARAIFGTAASAVLISALRQAAFGKKDDRGFWGEIFFALMDIQRFGLFADWVGDAIFGISRNENPAADLIDVPQLSGFGNLLLGVYKILKGKGEKTLIQSVPLFRAIEHLAGEEELDDEIIESATEVGENA